MSTRILLVNRDLMAGQKLARELAAAGFEVFAARDIPTTLQMIQSQHPDMALVEAGLSKDTGLDLITQIRGQIQTRRLPVILLGSPSENDDPVQYLEAGADGYLSRPFSAAVVVAQVRALLRRV